MRWDELFADLEGHAAQLERDDRAVEVSERARGEVGRLRLVDRLQTAVGSVVRLQCAGGLQLRGTLRRTGSEWLLLDEEPAGQALVVLASVLMVGGLGRLSAVPGSEGIVASRLGIRSALRGIVLDRSPVRVHLSAGEALMGTLDRVGADFVELATHPGGETRRRGEVREVLVVATNNLTAVRRG